MPAFVRRASFITRRLHLFQGHLAPAVLRRENDRDVLTGGFLRGIAKYALGAGIPPFDVPFCVEHHDGVVLYALHHQPEARIRFTEESLRMFAFRDVDGHADEEAAPVS